MPRIIESIERVCGYGKMTISTCENGHDRMTLSAFEKKAGDTFTLVLATKILAACATGTALLTGTIRELISPESAISFIHAGRTQSEF